MKGQLVFQKETEMERLRVQNDLLSCYEDSVFRQIFSERHNLSVLDVGCNDGMKTAERFSSDSVSCVIGLEYNDALAIKAEKLYGNEKFSFYACDVEKQGFQEWLRSVMAEKQVDGFDVIFLSFVLMHLSDVSQFLAAIRPFLKIDGKLFIVEADDAASTLSNDDNRLLDQFFEILKKDKYSGNREVGRRICQTLSDCGYENICVWHDAVSAAEGEKEKKNAIFTTFFTYLSEDVLMLLDAEPESEEYKSWSAWLACNYKPLRQLILHGKSVISIGMKILTCTKGCE